MFIAQNNAFITLLFKKYLGSKIVSQILFEEKFIVSVTKCVFEQKHQQSFPRICFTHNMHQDIKSFFPSRISRPPGASLFNQA